MIDYFAAFCYSITVMKTKTERVLLLNEKQIKMLDNIIRYMYESERQNFEEYFADGGKKGGHILNDVMKLEKYCDTNLGKSWNKD